MWNNEEFKNTFYIDEKEEECIIKSQREIQALERKLLLFEIAEVIEENTFSIEELPELLQIYEVQADEVETIFLDLYSKFEKGIILGEEQSQLKRREVLNEITRKWYYLGQEERERILKDNIANLALKEISTSDYVVDTLESSLWIILNTDSFSEALVGAINLGGDTASIGSITGSIAGYIYASDEVPERWLDKIKHFNYLEQIIEEYEKILKTQ